MDPTLHRVVAGSVLGHEMVSHAEGELIAESFRAKVTKVLTDVANDPDDIADLVFTQAGQVCHAVVANLQANQKLLDRREVRIQFLG